MGFARLDSARTKDGRRAGGVDLAAAALGIGARLVTGNPKDFPMKELEVEPWPAGA